MVIYYCNWNDRNERMMQKYKIGIFRAHCKRLFDFFLSFYVGSMDRIHIKTGYVESSTTILIRVFTYGYRTCAI